MSRTQVNIDLSDEKTFKIELFHDRAHWFIQLRWTVILIFLLLSTVAAFKSTEAMGITLEACWLGWTALLLGLMNGLYLAHLKLYVKSHPEKVTLNVAVQIFIDLLAVTLVVHKVGSLTTFVPFLYSIHIVLSCIFFRARSSLYILSVSSILYIGCVLGEHVKLLPTPLPTYTGTQPELAASAKIIQVLSALLIWATVWYLSSRLSTIIQARNLELAKAHKRVKEMFQISQHHMHQTAHQMKSPLAAIQSNLLLMDMHLGDEKDERTEDLMKRTHVRCENLHEQVRDILHLANIKAGDQVTRQFIDIEIATMLEKSISGLQSNAESRNIMITTDIEATILKTDHDVLKVILDNLISNAINYSHDGGEVTITCSKNTDDSILLKIADQGIGIPEEKIGQIFEDFFRTDTAKKHCRYSTGMGLAIVKHAAITLNIQTCVESEVGKGTSFTLNIPLNPLKD